MNIEPPVQGRADYSVVYSFFNKWEEPLRGGRVHVFFRKRFPSRLPQRVYFYIGAPVMAVVGSARITKIERVSVEQALELSDKGCIPKAELTRYLGDRDSVGAIHMDDFSFFKNPVSADALASSIVFSPPQNFQNLSNDDEEVLMELSR